MINLKKSYIYTEYETMLIKKTLLTIENLYYSSKNIALSFSGGKDSTVLFYIIRNILQYNIPIVYCNTGVEYDSINTFVDSFENIIKVKPKHSFLNIINKYGYPVISKEQSRYIEDIKNPNICQKLKDKRLSKGNFSISKKWRYLLDQDDFKISDKCCYHLKKAPLRKLKYFYLTGERIQESNLRKQRYHTCVLNNKAIPLRLWDDNLINKFIYSENIKICDIYKYEKRTGCKFCLYGIHLEDKTKPDKIDRLEHIEPKSYVYAEKIGLIKIKKIIKFLGNKTKLERV